MLKRLGIKRKNIISDLISGLTVALVNIPEGIAYATVAGVNPVLGLYSAIVAPIVGVLTAGSVFVVITLTNETALVTASTLESLDYAVSFESIFSLTFLTGIFALIFGIFKLGKYLRFVSESVMTGFITGAAVLVILGQLGKFLGYYGSVEGSNLLEALDLLIHINQISLTSAFVGIVTIGVILLVKKTKLKNLALVISLLFAMLYVNLFNLDVALIGNSAQISGGLPHFTIPDFAHLFDYVLPAFSLAILSVILGAGIAKNYTNPDKKSVRASKDFVGIGAANIAGSFFQGLPVTASLSRTSILVTSGAKSRWANIFAGLGMMIFIVTIIKIAEFIPQPALAGLLIYVGYEAIGKRRLFRAWETHEPGRIAMVSTFFLTLVIPIHLAVYGGVIISLLIFIYIASTQVRVKQIAINTKGELEELDQPKEYKSNTITILQIYGGQFFGSVDYLDRHLPRNVQVENSAIIFAFRGRETINGTFITWMLEYIRELKKQNVKIMFAEIHPNIIAQFKSTRAIRTIGKENVFEAEKVIGASIKKANNQAEKWLSKN